MIRRGLAILTIACFLASASGLSLAIHLHLWHAEHGEDSHHDNDRCPVLQAMVSASQAEVGQAPLLVADADLGCWDCRPAALPPRLTCLPQPIEPRAPPVLAL